MRLSRSERLINKVQLLEPLASFFDVLKILFIHSSNKRMIENLPIYISLTLGLRSIATLLLFIRTIKRTTAKSTQRKATLIFYLLIVWLIIQSILSLTNTYKLDLNTFPPKILLFGIIPPILAIISLFITVKGKKFIDSLPLKNLTTLNIVRVPVEIILYWLSLNKTVPQSMTFESHNFDIIAGITALLVTYYGFI